MPETKVWNGSAWVSCRPKIWNGTTWETEGRYWDGTGWKFLYPELDVLTVNATAAGYSNYQLSPPDSAPTYVGVQFKSNGVENKFTDTGGVTYVGNWLTAGTASDCWVEFIRTGGTEAAWDGKSNSTRYQLNVDQNFELTAGLDQQDTIIGYFRFWNASSGGTMVDQTTTGQTWEAWTEFDACPTCCFTPETLILMADNTHMPIGEIQPGDLIRVENGIESVGEVIVRENRFMFHLTFSDGNTLILSDDHPIYVENKGYASVNPVYGEYKDLGVPKKLEVGDKAIKEDGRTVKITEIQKYEYRWEVYTLSNTKFFAGGILVY